LANFSGSTGWLSLFQLTASWVMASSTMNLSAGLLPVRPPVVTTKAPLLAMTPFVKKIITWKKFER
jgi:hypothetical protein